VASLSDAQREFVDRNAFPGIVTTVRPDGGLHSTVVWVGTDGGDVVFTTLRSRAKARHLERDPRVSLLVVDPADQYRWLSLSGTAELSEHGAAARMERLAKKYMGPDAEPWTPPGQTWVECRIRADRITTAGVG
jgi:PPOX class probable F420-dependent enzyme